VVKIEEYDVIIAGAGPAGLSVAGELSNGRSKQRKIYGAVLKGKKRKRKIKILLIEKDKILEQKKVWATWADQLERHKLKNCIANTADFVLYGAKDVDYVRIKSNLSTIDEKKLLSTLKGRIKRKNCTIIENCKFNSFQRVEGGLVIKTSKGKFKTKLLVDAMGIPNRTIQNKKEVGMWQNLVFIFEGKNDNLSMKELTMCDEKGIEKDNTYSWLARYNKNKLLVGNYRFIQRPINYNLLEKELKVYIKLRKVKGKITKTYQGFIPAWAYRKLCDDNILIIGAAGSQITPSTACGLIGALDSGALAAEAILDCISKENFSRKQLKEYEEKWWRINRIRMTSGTINQLFFKNYDHQSMKKHINFIKKFVYELDYKTLHNIEKNEFSPAELKKILNISKGEYGLNDFLKFKNKVDILRLLKCYIKLNFYLFCEDVKDLWKNKKK